MPFSIVRSDIACLDVDAVVNAANEGLIAGGGVCGAIFSAAGYEQLQAACRKIAPCPTGGAMVTRGFDLPARWIIHAVGPRWIDGHHGEEGLLRRAYRSALDQAARLRVTSVAFPLISAGIYGYPPTAALDVACEEIARFLSDRAGTDAGEMRVVLAVYDRQAFAESLDCYDEVALCIQDAQGEESFFACDSAVCAQAAEKSCDLGLGPGFDLDLDLHALAAPAAASRRRTCAATPRAIDETEIAELLEGLDASFSQTVLSLIDARGLTDVEVYKRANLSRQLFSKIRRDQGYKPTKATAVALAIALELSLDECNDLLERAGFSLSSSSKFDVIVRYFIERECYDIYKLNAMLFAFDQPLLGSM